MHSFLLGYITIPGSSDYSNLVGVPKGMRFWAKLKGGISRFSKKSEYKFDTSNLFLHPASAQQPQDATTVPTVLKCNKGNNDDLDVGNGSNEDGNNIKTKSDSNDGSQKILPVIQVEQPANSKLVNKEENSIKASEMASVTVHSPPCKIELSHKEQCKKIADIPFETLSIDSNGKYKNKIVSNIHSSFYFIYN